MTFVVAERTFPAPQTVDLVQQGIRDAGGCNALYSITHLGSLLGPDGRQVVCFYRAPDAEVVRSSSHRQGTPYDRVWSATLHGQGPDPVTAWALPQGTDDTPSETVLVSRAFEAPVVLEDLQAQEDAQAWCLQSHRVRFLQSLVSLDRRRMLCLYAAPDAEAVRHAQRGAGLPFEQIWTAMICRA
jgi:hypothetical protein